MKFIATHLPRLENERRTGHIYMYMNLGKIWLIQSWWCNWQRFLPKRKLQSGNRNKKILPRLSAGKLAKEVNKNGCNSRWDRLHAPFSVHKPTDNREAFWTTDTQHCPKHLYSFSHWINCLARILKNSLLSTSSQIWSWEAFPGKGRVSTPTY